MKQLVGVSKVSDKVLRKAVEKLSDDEKENIISKLSVSHTVFQNWLDGKCGFGSSKKRNSLLHLLEV